MLGHQRQDEGELDGEVAVAHGVEAVGGDALEPEPRSNVVPIDRQARARQGRGAQRQDVRPAAAVGQPQPVALELLAVGQPVVRGQDRLRPLDVGIAGQDHVGVGVAAADQRPLQGHQPLVDPVDRPADPEPQVGGHLIVSAAGGVQFSPHVAEPVDQRPLDVHVDVFEFGAERESALLNFLADFLERLLNLAAFVEASAGRPWPTSGRGRSSRRCHAHTDGGRSSRFR